jgi:hypothetical protein
MAYKPLKAANFPASLAGIGKMVKNVHFYEYDLMPPWRINKIWLLRHDFVIYRRKGEAAYASRRESLAPTGIPLAPIKG